MNSETKKRGPYLKWANEDNIPRQTKWSRKQVPKSTSVKDEAGSRTLEEKDRHSLSQEEENMADLCDDTSASSSTSHSDDRLNTTEAGSSGAADHVDKESDVDLQEFMDWEDALEEEHPLNNEGERFADSDDCLSDDDNENDSPDKDQEISDDTPLYAGSRLTISASMLLILTFALRHGLTGNAIHDLLSIIELHCLSENFCKSTVRLFHDFFCRIKKPIECHYFCSSCGNYFGKTETSECTLCSSKDIKYFITMPITSQLGSILSRPPISSVIQQNLRKRKSSTDGIGDVYDGRIYGAQFDRSGFFHGTEDATKESEIHLSLQINTDGVSLFRTSRFGIWPIYGIINELPPSLRFKKENRLFMGLWFGDDKPAMNIFFTPMVKEMHHLYTQGTNINGKTCRVVILSSVADAPARSLMLNCLQFNGTYGCSCCYAPGERIKVGEGRGFSRVYPFDVSSDSGHAKCRQHSETVQYGKKVDKEFDSGKKKTATPEFGIKGSTVLSFLSGFDIIRGTTIDYMHCVFLGVTKMFLSSWFDSKNRKERWSVRKSMKELSQRLTSIQPPNFIKRMPRSFEDLAHWKASEFQSFLLFFSLPVMSGVLEDEYLAHWMLLSQAIYILSCDVITVTGLQTARSSIRLFCLQVKDLYGARYETFNTHCLLHLCDKVCDLGPLWAHSCFYFEGFNGELRLLFHGTQNVQSQIMRAISIQQSIPDMVKSLPDMSSAKQLYCRITSRKRITSAWTEVGKDIFAIGRLIKWNLPAEIKRLITNSSEGSCSCFKFLRLCFHGQIVQSVDYCCVKRRQSYTICYNDDSIGFVLYYIKWTHDASGISCYAVVQKLDVQDVPNFEIYNNVRHLLVKKTEEIDVIQVESIKSMCVYMDMPGKDVGYVINRPNGVEID